MVCCGTKYPILNIYPCCLGSIFCHYCLFWRISSSGRFAVQPTRCLQVWILPDTVVVCPAHPVWIFLFSVVDVFWYILRRDECSLHSLTTMKPEIFCFPHLFLTLSEVLSLFLHVLHNEVRVRISVPPSFFHIILPQWFLYS